MGAGVGLVDGFAPNLAAIFEGGLIVTGLLYMPVGFGFTEGTFPTGLVTAGGGATTPAGIVAGYDDDDDV